MSIKYIVFCGLLVAITACENEKNISPPISESFDLLNTPVGDVNFPVSCNTQAAQFSERGVALLHHMMYDYAKFLFGMAALADPECGIAYWGQAMTIIHPLWSDHPTDAELENGKRLVELSLGESALWPTKKLEN